MLYKVRCADCNKDFEYFFAGFLNINAKHYCEKCREERHKRVVKGLAEIWNKKYSKK